MSGAAHRDGSRFQNILQTSESCGRHTLSARVMQTSPPQGLKYMLRDSTQAAWNIPESTSAHPELMIVKNS